ncbi:MAG TPA: DUF6599 family protein [Pyrinomonadaceae bacterium]|nr:DUF6599 family protein [Pyrinomonadaceae bacterium]
MRHRFCKLLYIAAIFSLLLSITPVRADEPVREETAQLLPDRAGDFQARGAALPSKSEELLGASSPAEFGPVSSATRTYASPKGETFSVTVVKTRSDATAYSLLTTRTPWGKGEAKRLSGVGTAGIAWEGQAAFFKGPAFVYISDARKSSGESPALVELARKLSESLDAGENEIPVLIKHLPEWETAQERAVFVVGLQALQTVAGGRPVLDAVSFDGGAEAVTALYGPSRLVIVENMTPQLATTNDERIAGKLRELRDSGQPVPTAYRRVGNYSVFVFDAPDEATATKLIESVKYEQVVQWLGQNPRAYQRAMREYTNTTAGVILAVLKASGLSLLVCLGVGAVFGGIVFRRRRQQQTTNEAFSDAGGMVRLNLDEISQIDSTGKLIGPGQRG